MGTGKRMGCSNTQCKATSLLLTVWTGKQSARNLSPPSVISRFSFFSFFPPLSSAHHCCQTTCNLFSISRLFINSTTASARRTSLSLLEQASSTALAHYSRDDGRKAKSATSAYQDRYSVLVNSSCHLDTRWPYSSSILHWPSDATVMTAHIRTRIQSLTIPAKASPLTALQCFHTRRCQKTQPI